MPERQCLFGAAESISFAAPFPSKQARGETGEAEDVAGTNASHVHQESVDLCAVVPHLCWRLVLHHVLRDGCDV